MEKAY